MNVNSGVLYSRECIFFIAAERVLENKAVMMQNSRIEMNPMSSPVSFSLGRRALFGSVAGFLVGLILFVCVFAAFTVSKDTFRQGLIGEIFNVLTYVPLKAFAWCVDRDMLNKHDAIAAMVFIGSWFCLLFSMIGCMLALLSMVRVMHAKRADRQPSTITSQ